MDGGVFVSGKCGRHLDVPDDWSPGICRYYGTAELRQSDHRPVICILDVQAQVVDEEARSEVLADVIRTLGPPDGTIVITPESLTDGGNVEAIFDDKFIDTLLEEFSSISEVILIRFVENTMWVTFKEGSAALSALKLNGLEVNGHVLDVRLRSPDWEDYVRKELELFSENTVPFWDSDLASDAVVEDQISCTPSLAEMQEYYTSIDEGDAVGDTRSAPPRRPAPPSRPPRPASATLKLVPKVAVISRPARPPAAGSSSSSSPVPVPHAAVREPVHIDSDESKPETPQEILSDSSPEFETASPVPDPLEADWSPEVPARPVQPEVQVPDPLETDWSPEVPARPLNSIQIEQRPAPEVPVRRQESVKIDRPAPEIPVRRQESLKNDRPPPPEVPMRKQESSKLEGPVVAAAAAAPPPPPPRAAQKAPAVPPRGSAPAPPPRRAV
ncbi:unnamed protein product [Notodromas monacha]|uniref:Synaptojanin-1/2 RNA recognition motif domain-containing protein n=1 Tax=Notodromas monacha TaxID=399045 RepID=A0A7R9BZG4_9CRUS|nr:unnamed protein product [Notodromas monacha]CAG0923524.1 unnamed protein product [Notodromas monacha]